MISATGADMAEAVRAMDMANMPEQRPAKPATPAAARARFFNSGNAFNIKLPAVPAASFTAEPARALAGDTPTSFLPCDQSGVMATGFPATTPLMLARYAVIAAGETLVADFIATGSIWYVIRGAGTAAVQAETIAFRAGDVFLLPSAPARLSAGDAGVTLWLVTNEPQLAFDSGRAPDAGHMPVAPVHYPAAEIARQIALIYQHAPNEATSGIALIFSSDKQTTARNIMPTLTLSLNSLPAGENQRAHRHNSAAVTLVVGGEDCHSMVDGVRCPWSPWATLVTPPGAPHSHHNAGATRALFLIVQDGGLHYHARTMGFEFLE